MTEHQRIAAENRRTSGLTKTVAKGMGWLIGSSSSLTLLSLLTQLALGWWLSKDDFGVYALAASCAVLLQVFRDGGVQLWLARQNVEDYHSHAAPAFWLSILCSLVVATALLLISPFAGMVYANSDVTQLMILLGLATPIQTLSAVPDAGLQVEMRFRDLALVRTAGGSCRYGLTIVLALWGFGPYSFVWPLFAAGLLQATISFAKMGLRPTTFEFSLESSKTVLHGSAWAFMGAFASAIFRQIDYIVLGLIAPVGIVGIYFFAYQLSMQPGLLLSQNIRKVFVPGLAAASDDPARRYRAVLLTARFIGLIASPLIIYLALAADGIEYLLWRGKWEAAVLSIRFLAASVPMHLFAVFSLIIIQSDGRFRLWSAVVSLRGLSVGAAVLASALFGGSSNASIVAAAVAIALLVGGLAQAITMLRCADLPVMPVVRGFLAPYLSALTLGTVIWLVSEFYVTATGSGAQLVSTLVYFVGVSLVTLTCFRGPFWQLVDKLRSILPTAA